MPRTPQIDLPPAAQNDTNTNTTAPAWLARATEETAASAEFRQLCRELLWRMPPNFGLMARPEQDALLEAAYGQMVLDGAAAGQFEALVAARYDGARSAEPTHR